MRVALYTRVSTDKQEVDPQLHELRRYCAGRGWNQLTEVTDTVSGSRFDRGGLEELMHMVRKGRIDVIVCAKLDRLGRSLSHLAQTIHELTSHGVALVIPSQGIDTSHSNPAAKLQLHVLCAVAEFEREVIRERVLAGLEVAKARGVKLGRRDITSCRKAEILALRHTGDSVRSISKKLKMPVSSVWKVIKQHRDVSVAANLD